MESAMNRAHHGLLPLLLTLVLASCGGTQPCDEYVDYICTCHESDPDYDCEQVRTVYEDAAPDVQDSCALSYDELKKHDQEEGMECTVG
jgi:hypothetical protein